MRSSVLPLVEPDGPVINPLAACLKLEVLKIAWVFPDDVFFADGTTALIADNSERLGARAGWGMQGQVRCGIPVRRIAERCEVAFREVFRSGAAATKA